MASITLKGREIPLLYTTFELKALQEEIAPFSRMINIILGRNPDDQTDVSAFGSAEHIENVAKMIRILGNAGLEEAGEAADLTDKKVMRAIRPMDLMEKISACMDAINEGMVSEIPEKEDEGPVDVTLEEMKKKDPKEG